MEGGSFLVEVHVVQKGDTLWKISRQFGVSFDELKRVNGHLANPDYIVPGMKITLPARSKENVAAKKPAVAAEKKTANSAGCSCRKENGETRLSKSESTGKSAYSSCSSSTRQLRPIAENTGHQNMRPIPETPVVPGQNCRKYLKGQQESARDAENG